MWSSLSTEVLLLLFLQTHTCPVRPNENHESIVWVVFRHKPWLPCFEGVAISCVAKKSSSTLSGRIAKAKKPKQKLAKQDVAISLKASGRPISLDPKPQITSSFCHCKRKEKREGRVGGQAWMGSHWPLMDQCFKSTFLFSFSLSLPSSLQHTQIWKWTPDDRFKV